MIRNIIAYQIPHGWPYSAVEMTELLLRRQFVGCGPMDLAATGFVPPRDEAALCEPIAGRYLLCHQHEEKLLPASVVNEYVEIKCEEIEQAQGYKPGRKQRKDIKEQVIAELATERQAREALQEQLNASADEHDEIAGRTVGYLLPVSKKRGLYRRVKSFDDARRAALSHARRGGRVEVGAFVPVGEAVPGAEWRRS